MKIMNQNQNTTFDSVKRSRNKWLSILPFIGLMFLISGCLTEDDSIYERKPYLNDSPPKVDQDHSNPTLAGYDGLPGTPEVPMVYLPWGWWRGTETVEVKMDFDSSNGLMSVRVDTAFKKDATFDINFQEAGPIQFDIIYPANLWVLDSMVLPIPWELILSEYLRDNFEMLVEFDAGSKNLLLHEEVEWKPSDDGPFTYIVTVPNVEFTQDEIGILFLDEDTMIADIYAEDGRLIKVRLVRIG